MQNCTYGSRRLAPRVCCGRKTGLDEAAERVHLLCLDVQPYHAQWIWQLLIR